MTIAEVCIAARAEGLSYGNYVAKYLTGTRGRSSPPALRAKKPGLKRDQGCRQYTANGKFVVEFDSVEQAAAAMGTDIENLRRALRGQTDTCLGYQWRYVYDETPVKRKPVICQYSPEGDLVAVYQSGTEAAAVCNGNIPRAIKFGWKAGGFYWTREYID